MEEDIPRFKMPNRSFCIQCGKEKSQGMENYETGEIIPLDFCVDCLFAPTEHNFIQAVKYAERKLKESKNID